MIRLIRRIRTLNASIDGMISDIENLRRTVTAANRLVLTLAESLDHLNQEVFKASLRVQMGAQGVTVTFPENPN